MPEESCPTNWQLERYLLGQLGDQHLHSIAEHLDACDRCGSLAPSLERQSDRLLNDLQNRHAADPFEEEPQLLEAMAALLDDKVGQAAAPVQKAELPAAFGRYRIGEEVGAGAMGTVFRAYDTQLERQVALKVPHFRPDDDCKLRERFLRESKSAAGIQHANICQVYDAGEIDGVCFIAMSFVDGQPLSKRLESQQPIPPAQAVELVRIIALAMQEAHWQGVVHRDLKPSNIILGPRGEPVVTDFGLASRDEGLDEARLTHDGMLIGSPAYMSPEQVNGRVGLLGPSCDIYALGVILFELLTGELPYQGPVTSVLGQILRNPSPRPSSRHSSIPVELDAICARAMAKEPSARYRTMAKFAQRLEEYQQGRYDARADVQHDERPAGSQPGNVTSPGRPDNSVVTSTRTQDFWRSNRLLVVLLGASALLLPAVLWQNFGREPAAGTVRIRVTRPDGDVYIDGELYSREALSNELTLSPGAHPWQFRIDGFTVYVGKITVRPGSRSEETIP